MHRVNFLQVFPIGVSLTVDPGNAVDAGEGVVLTRGTVSGSRGSPGNVGLF